MDPRIWGPGLWRYIHSTAAAASSQQKRLDFEAWIKTTAKTLPCEKCKAHFLKNLETFPIKNYMTSNESLFMWTYLMHDAVNASQGKTGDQRPTFETVYKQYFDVATDSNAVDFKQDYHDPICHDVCTSQMLNSGLQKDLTERRLEVGNGGSGSRRTDGNKTVIMKKHDNSSQQDSSHRNSVSTSVATNSRNHNEMKNENSSQSLKKFLTKRPQLVQ